MSYQVIARKYRPQTFEDVVGQKPIVTTLKNAVEQRRVHHAYLFSGPRGVGKTTVARLLAKALNCAQGPTPRPCNECSSCAEIAQSRSMDVLEIDGASNRGIENIRELRETVRYAPARDRYKVFIIDEVHMLTDPAWNALLKTLEEPPPYAVFVFATTEYREIPLTILSRCQHFEFRKVAPPEILAHLAQVARGEGIAAEPKALELIARVAEGSLRDALSALDQVIAFSGEKVTDEQARTILGIIDRELILGFFSAVGDKDCGTLVSIVDTVFEKGYHPVEFLEDLMAHGRDLLLARTVSDPARFLTGSPEEIEALRARAATFSEDELLRILELLTREEGRVKSSSHPRYLLEALGIKLARLADLRSIDDLIARLENDGGAVPPAPGPGPGPHPLGPGPGVRPAAATAPVVLGAPAPPPPAPARPGSEALVEALLRRVHDERGAIGGFLAQAVWIHEADGTLRIVFNEKQAFFRDQVQSREVTDYLRRVARELSGRELGVQVDIAPPGFLAPAPTGPVAGDSRPETDVTRPIAAVSEAPPPPGARPASEPPAAGRAAGAGAQRPSSPPIDEASRRALLEQALLQPEVRSLLDALGGEIVDIEPA